MRAVTSALDLQLNHEIFPPQRQGLIKLLWGAHRFHYPQEPPHHLRPQACLTSGHLGHFYHYLHPATFKGFGAAFVPFSPLNTQQFLEWRLVTAFTFREFLSASPKSPDDRLG